MGELRVRPAARTHGGAAPGALSSASHPPETAAQSRMLLIPRWPAGLRSRDLGHADPVVDHRRQHPAVVVGSAHRDLSAPRVPGGVASASLAIR